MEPRPQPKRKKSSTKKISITDATAPKVPGMPTPKEPSSIHEPLGADMQKTAPKATTKKLKITVDGEDTDELAVTAPSKKVTVTVVHDESDDSTVQEGDSKTSDVAADHVDVTDQVASEPANAESDIQPTAPLVEGMPVSEPESSDSQSKHDTQPAEIPQEAQELIEPTQDTSEQKDEDVSTEEAAGDNSGPDEGDLADDSEPVDISHGNKPPRSYSVGRLIKAWWHNRRARWVTIALIVITMGISASVPTSRYSILNKVGVRSSLSITVVDASTQLPLKNATVSLNSISGKTDSYGKVKLSNIKLGSALLTIEKRAFTPQNKTVVVGWGSNPLGEVAITPSGLQFGFVVSDFLSGKPVSKVEAASGDASAVSDDKGIIKLTMDNAAAQTDEIPVTITAAGYRTETVRFSADKKQNIPVKLVPAKKHIFVSKRSGKYDVYSVDIDGKNEKVILAGTGNERDDMVVVPHPTESIVAVVSTRDDKRNKDGFLLSNLTLVDLSDDTSTLVAQSERIQIADWVDKRLVYVEISAGASAANPKRQRLVSYDYRSVSKKELATSNYFNDIKVVKGKIYYAPSSMYSGSQISALYRVEADGNYKTKILDTETWNIFRTGYDMMVFAPQQLWYQYRLGDAKPTKLDGQPANLNNRIYIDSPDAKTSLWVDNRDGKGVLLGYDVNSKKDTIITALSGLKYPVQWINNRVLIYRIATDLQTTDYALSLDGGEPVKIRDVSNTGSLNNWYYY